MRRILFMSLLTVVPVCLLGFAQGGERDKYLTLFDGKSLDGWHVSAKTGHSGASKHKSGGKWVIEEGAIVGSQDIPGNGGIIITDKKFKNFEVVLEMNNDFGPDSGLFLRSTEDGKAYQAMIDYHANGNLMGIYGEGIGGFGSHNFKFLDSPDKIAVAKVVEGTFACPVTAEEWTKFWKHGQWNEFKARIIGNPPTIHTWINGKKFMEWTDDKKHHSDEGGIALQVHGGGDYTKQFVRYRKIRVKVVD